MSRYKNEELRIIKYQANMISPERTSKTPMTLKKWKWLAYTKNRPDIWKYQSEDKKFIGHDKNIYMLGIPERVERKCGRKCI